MAAVSLRSFNPHNRYSSKALFRLREFPRERRRRLAMTEMNISQFKSWLNVAQPKDVVTIAPLLISRIGTFDESDQERFIHEVKQNPQAKGVFQKLSVANL
jgi:hypothetical protein